MKNIRKLVNCMLRFEEIENKFQYSIRNDKQIITFFLILSLPGRERRTDEYLLCKAHFSSSTGWAAYAVFWQMIQYQYQKII